MAVWAASRPKVSVAPIRPWAPRKLFQQRNLEVASGWGLGTAARPGAAQGLTGMVGGVVTGRVSRGQGTVRDRRCPIGLAVVLFLVVRGAGRGERPAGLRLVQEGEPASTLSSPA